MSRMTNHRKKFCLIQKLDKQTLKQSQRKIEWLMAMVLFIQKDTKTMMMVRLLSIRIPLQQ
jgi:hypothetical protein